MKNVYLLFLLLVLLGCKNISDKKSSGTINSSSILEEIDKEKNIPYSEKSIDSILKIEKENNPILICKEENMELKIFSYGKIGEYAGLYSEAELASSVYYLKTFGNKKIIDSLEIYKKEIGEGVFKTKSFKFLTDKKFEISISESWEDIQTEKNSVIDSLYIYQIKENGKIEMLSKQETKKNLH